MPTPTETNIPPSIALRHVWKQFEAQPVLRDISIDVEPNETLALIGESGCGKSVTMKLMMSLLQPNRGEVFWSGRPVKSRSEAELNRERLQFG